MSAESFKPSPASATLLTCLSAEGVSEGFSMTTFLYRPLYGHLIEGADAAAAKAIEGALK
jgi:hypothetical protein